MQTIKTKFTVLSVTNASELQSSVTTAQVITLRPVIQQNGVGESESENASFSRYTPSGEISMNITNPNAFDFFEQGKEYYVDFKPADDASDSEPIAGASATDAQVPAPAITPGVIERAAPSATPSIVSGTAPGIAPSATPIGPVD